MTELDIHKEHTEKELEFIAYQLLLDNKIDAIQKQIEYLETGEDDVFKNLEIASLRIEKHKTQIESNAKKQFASEYRDRINHHKKIIDEFVDNMKKGNRWLVLVTDATNLIKNIKVTELQRQQLQRALTPFLSALDNRDFYDVNGAMNAHFVNCCRQLMNTVKSVALVEEHKTEKIEL